VSALKLRPAAQGFSMIGPTQGTVPAMEVPTVVASRLSGPRAADNR